MAYMPSSLGSSGNPPVLLTQPMAFGGGSTFGSTVGSTAVGGRLWVYVSTHLQTDVGTSDFISDGQLLGMKIHDVILSISMSSGITFHRVSAVGSTYIPCTSGLLISSAS